MPPAFEVFGVVDAAASLVDGVLRIRTERPRAIDHASGLVHGDEARRRNALLHPALERRHRVERRRSLASRGARREEQAEELPRLAVEIAAVVLAAVQEPRHLIVVLD